MNRRKMKTQIGVRLPNEMIELINKIVEQEIYANVSEYIRELIRNDLKRRGFIKEVKK